MKEIDLSNGIVMPNFSNYVVFPEEGKVWSLKSERFIGSPDEKGYWKVTMYDDNGKKRNFKLHRLIWMSVHGDIPESMEINHIDEDKSNCSIFNLNIMSHKENVNFGTGIERAVASRDYKAIAEKKSKLVAAYKNNVLAMVFPSTREAGRQGFNHSNISKCCRNCYLREGNNIYKGYTWIYFEDSPPLFYSAV